MRFLADGGISPRTVEFLTRLGHEAIHVRTLGMQRAQDPEVVERARADSSVVLTFDLDFGEVLALGILDKPSVIIFRLADQRADSVNQRLSAVLAIIRSVPIPHVRRTEHRSTSPRGHQCVWHRFSSARTMTSTREG